MMLLLARDLSIRPCGGGFNFVTHPRRSRGRLIGRLAITELTSAISTLDRGLPRVNRHGNGAFVPLDEGDRWLRGNWINRRDRLSGMKSCNVYLPRDNSQGKL